MVVIKAKQRGKRILHGHVILDRLGKYILWKYINILEYI
jgi:hypothetical protein